jgi:glutathione synthase/RimK-type ligase-like ATP-grasp enzyme
MAPNHWQIVKHGPDGDWGAGRVETVAIDDAPGSIVRTAVRAARLIGDGLYGVDLKLLRNRPCVIEVNDNPNIDSRFEDRILKDELYDRIIQSFIRRIERIRHHAERRATRAAARAV